MQYETIIHSIQETENKYLIPIYGKRDIALVRGEGVHVFDQKERPYLDLITGCGASSLGHAHPWFTHVIRNQAKQITSVHSSFYSDMRAKFLKKLHEVLPDELSRSFICSTGTESVEAALKFARLITGRPGFISAKRAYHGRTLGALSATAVPKYQKGFAPLLPGFKHVRYNDLEAMAEALDEHTAAVILEPIQGEAGINLPDENYLAKVKKLCEQNGTLLILDEVQTGLRTGDWLASTAMNVVPDILCLSKALGNGFPLGVTSVREELAEQIPKGCHGTTFGSNPFACAAGLATLEVIQIDELLKNSRDVGEIFLKKLKKLNSPLIREVRGRGLMIGIELKQRAGQYAKKLQEKGILVGASGNVLRLLPPLILKEEHLDEALPIFESALS